jgi:hypothetical protein
MFNQSCVEASVCLSSKETTHSGLGSLQCAWLVNLQFLFQGGLTQGSLSRGVHTPKGSLLLTSNAQESDRYFK